MDSPLFQLLEGYQAAPIDRLKTDVFRTQVAYAEALKKQLADAREGGVAALDAVRDGLGDIDTVEAGVAVDLLLSYRALSAWERVVDLCGRSSTARCSAPCWCASNGRWRSTGSAATARPRRSLNEMIAERGPSSETCGLLGRIHKDRWEKARKAEREIEARGHLRKAIAAYRQGFETDWRDAYPGVNAATLMTIADPRDRAAKEMAGVARYAVRQRLARGADYWDHATLVELAAIEGDWDAAEEALGDALAAARRRLEGGLDRQQPAADRRGARGGGHGDEAAARDRRRTGGARRRRRLTPGDYDKP